MGVAGNSLGMLAACVANWSAVKAALLLDGALMAKQLTLNLLQLYEAGWNLTACDGLGLAPITQ